MGSLLANAGLTSLSSQHESFAFTVEARKGQNVDNALRTGRENVNGMHELSRKHDDRKIFLLQQRGYSEEDAIMIIAMDRVNRSIQIG